LNTHVKVRVHYFRNTKMKNIVRISQRIMNSIVSQDHRITVMQCWLHFFNDIIHCTYVINSYRLNPYTSKYRAIQEIICLLIMCIHVQILLYKYDILSFLYTDESQRVIKDCQRSMVPTSSTSHYAGCGDSCTTIGCKF
jgi:hypothetical protein